jgi:hypothetical protein
MQFGTLLTVFPRNLLPSNLSSLLKKEASCSSETLLHIYRTTYRHFSQDHNIDTDVRDNIEIGE